MPILDRLYWRFGKCAETIEGIQRVASCSLVSNGLIWTSRERRSFREDRALSCTPEERVKFLTRRHPFAGAHLRDRERSRGGGSLHGRRDLQPF